MATGLGTDQSADSPERRMTTGERQQEQPVARVVAVPDRPGLIQTWRCAR